MLAAMPAGIAPALLPALRFDGQRPGVRLPAPRLGEHNHKYRAGEVDAGGAGTDATS